MNPNPFALDGVIRILLEEADIPTLKTLRELDNNWNTLDLMELEIRASKGEFRETNFSWGHRGNNLTEEEAKEELANFLKSTMAIPQLFSGFQIHFPATFKILNSSFFSQYHPKFIRFDFDSLFIFDEDSTKLLHNFLRWVAPSIMELRVGFVWSKKWRWNFEIQKIQGQLVMPKLIKLNLRDAKLLAQFRVILDKGGKANPTPNLKELLIEDLKTDFGDLLGIDTGSKIGSQRWTILTHLTLHTNNHFFSNIDVSKIIQNLCTLAQNGMILRYFDLKFRGEYQILDNFSGICSILTQFLESQSQTLEFLGLSFSFNITRVLEDDFEESNQIRLPKFPHLITLQLNKLRISVNGVRQIPLQILEPLSIHFPKLKTLAIFCPNLIRDLFDDLEPWSVPEIIYFDMGFGGTSWEQILNWLKSNFSSVRKFECNHDVVNGLEIPWADTLECLQIVISTKWRNSFKLRHLAHLQYLLIFKSFIPNSDQVYRKSVHAFLEDFSDALKLNLTFISFETEKEVCDEVKGHIRSYFPYEVVFVTSKFLL